MNSEWQEAKTAVITQNHTSLNSNPAGAIITQLPHPCNKTDQYLESSGLKVLYGTSYIDQTDNK